MNRLRNHAETLALERNPRTRQQESSTMDSNVYPFTPRSRTDTDPPTRPSPAASRSSPAVVYTVKEVSQYLRISLGGTYALIHRRDPRQEARWPVGHP